MTISYSDTFGKLLLRWRGSLWAAIWLDLLVFLGLYFSISVVYRCALNEEQQETFAHLVTYFENATSYIPLTFLLGFFVFAVVARWWDQFNYISWPDKVMIYVTTYITGDENRMVRRTIARWLNLAAALAWRGISLRTIKRFPTVEHLVKAGLMTDTELEVYNNTEGPHGKWFLPILWINTLIKRCHQNNVVDSVQLKNLMKIVDSYRGGFAMLFVYDWVSVPLVYTQVVAIATYGYFAICLMGRQILLKEDIQIFVPIFTILQFLFYMGWLKVGQALMNPFGEDDDDFELNYILDRNIYIAYMLADDVHGQIPALEKDIFWDTKRPSIPHTMASMKVKDIIPEGHLTNFRLTDEEMELIDPESQVEVEDGTTTTPGQRISSLVRTLSRRNRNRDADASIEDGARELQKLAKEEKERNSKD